MIYFNKNDIDKVNKDTDVDQLMKDGALDHNLKAGSRIEVKTVIKVVSGTHDINGLVLEVQGVGIGFPYINESAENLLDRTVVYLLAIVYPFEKLIKKFFTKAKR